jgi:hypothetical protein
MASAPEQKQPELSEVSITLIACGVLGFLLIVAGPVIFIAWEGWSPLINWLQEGKRDHLWKPALAIGSMFLGLMVMFGGLQTARKYERTDRTLRVLIYGYNAVLEGLLLLVFLFVINAAIYIWVPRFLDTTEGGIHTLSDVTRRYVSELNKPVHVWMILPEGSESYRKTSSMLTELHDLNPKYFTYEEVSPSFNQTRIQQLMLEFPAFTGESGGLIVKFGDAKENYGFIPYNELVKCITSKAAKRSR